MIITADLDAAKRLVNDLRSHSDEQNARVVEQLIAAAGAPQDVNASVQSSDLLTIRQAARALNVRVQTNKSWVAAGKVPASEINDQVMVRRSSLLAYLDSLRSSRPGLSSGPADEATRREILHSLEFPPEMLDRLRELLDARQERSLSPEYKAELDQLETLSARISAARLQIGRAHV